MIVVGLTGGIGSGKTTVLKMFEQLNIKTYNADVEARRLINSSSEIKEELVAAFGKEAYIEEVLNRPFIGSIVFKDPKKLAVLNRITHPRLHQHLKYFLSQQTGEYIVYEAAILLESEGHKLCDFIITVTADKAEKIKRIQLRDGLSKKDIAARMNSQISDKLRADKSDFIITNNHLKSTQEQVFCLNNILSDLSNAK